MQQLNRRTLLAGLLSTILVVAFAGLGGVGFAKGSISAAQYQYGKKVTICHKGKNTITISVNAWPAHKRHGDTQGPCKNPKKDKGKHKGQPGHDTPSTPSTQAPSPSHGNGNGHGNGQGNGKKK